MARVKSYRYVVVDVFTREPLAGKSLAVFPDAAGLDEITMQKIAKEINLTETVFVLPATHKDCAARVRIFSPARELAFAGHPTVGTAFVLLQEGIVSENSAEFILEEQIGPVPIRIETGQPPLIWLRMPPIREGTGFLRPAMAGCEATSNWNRERDLVFSWQLFPCVVALSSSSCF